MAGITTTISLEKELVERVNKIAEDMHVSRSRLFTLALRELVKKYEKNNLLAQINAAYDDAPDEEEIKLTRAMKLKQRRNIDVEQW